MLSLSNNQGGFYWVEIEEIWKLWKQDDDPPLAEWPHPRACTLNHLGNCVSTTLGLHPLASRGVSVTQTGASLGIGVFKIPQESLVCSHVCKLLLKTEELVWQVVGCVIQWIETSNLFDWLVLHFKIYTE